jgi:uncharacterized membrane protein HdeD (DUF308 family)
VLLAGAATSAVAAIALGIAASGSAANVFAVVGVWAGLSGAAQLVVGLRRRAQLGKQWPMLLAGGGSVIFGTRSTRPPEESTSSSRSGFSLGAVAA